MEETKNWKKKTEGLIRQDKGGGKKEKKKKGRKTDNTHFKQGQIIFQRIKERKRERRTASHEIIVSLTIPKELDKIRETFWKDSSSSSGFFKRWRGSRGSLQR